MSKHRSRTGFILLLGMLLLPHGAVAASGASVNGASAMKEALAQLIELVTAIFLPADELDGRCIADPWGCPAPAGGGLGTGIDPWN